MSRLHRQKLRLRAQQRGDGLIDADSDTVDRDAFHEIGSTHQAARVALELVARTGAADDSDQPAPATDVTAPAAVPATIAPDTQNTTGESARLRSMVASFLTALSPAELDMVRAHFERTHPVATGVGAALEGESARNGAR